MTPRKWRYMEAGSLNVRHNRTSDGSPCNAEDEADVIAWAKLMFSLIAMVFPARLPLDLDGPASALLIQAKG